MIKNLLKITAFLSLAGCATIPVYQVIGQDAAGKHTMGIIRVVQNTGASNPDIENLARQWCSGSPEFTIKKDSQWMATNWLEWRMYPTTEIYFNCPKPK